MNPEFFWFFEKWVSKINVKVKNNGISKPKKSTRFDEPNLDFINR